MAQSKLPPAVNGAVLIVVVFLIFRLLDLVLTLKTAIEPSTLEIGASALGLAVGILILSGLVKGHRLAWQWGRVMGIIGGISIAVRAYAETQGPYAQFSIASLVIDGIQIVALLTLSILLSKPEARTHFRLTCPKCGSDKPKPDDFFFNTARCTACRHLW
jgi:hypothetical protein